MLMKSKFYHSKQSNKYADKSSAQKISTDMHSAQEGDTKLIRSLAKIDNASLSEPFFETEFRKKNLVLVDVRTK